jgi:radical SAM superfamily enzyme YgiQ (UPF0313 family)
MFAIGADTDTKESILATLDFCKKVNLDSVQFLILTPIPGSKLFYHYLEQGRIFTTDWDIRWKKEILGMLILGFLVER